MQRAEFKFRHTFYQKPAAETICYRSPFCTEMVAGFLGEQIIRKRALYRGAKYRHFTCLMHIAVGAVGAHAVISNALIAGRHCQLKAETRQKGEIVPYLCRG